MTNQNFNGSDSWRSGPNQTHAGTDAKDRLTLLGFSEPENVREALQNGASAARSAMTPKHPATYAGQRMWGETTASLGFLTETDGFETECFKGVDLLVNSDRSIAVIVTSGDQATGSPSHLPQVRYDRKQAVASLINGERDTLWDSHQKPRIEWQVWLLLHNLVSKDRIIPAELSLPVTIVDGKVRGWSERIIIPSFDDEFDSTSVEIDDDLSPIVPNVQIRRRAS